MADRTVPSRHATRNRAAPYPSSRPGEHDHPLAKPLAGPLALFSGLFNFITRPWGSRSREAHLKDVEESGSGIQTANPAAQALHDRAVEMDAEAAAVSGQQGPEQRQFARFTVATQQQSQPLPPPPPPPPRNPPLSNLPPPPRRQQESTGEDDPLHAVSAFLAEKAGQTLNRVEYAGVMSMLAKTVTDDEQEKREPFRFSTSPAPSAPTPPTQPPRAPRMLTKNPNGTYKWNGAASAKPRKLQNRYASPAFGPSKSKSSIVLELTPSESKGKKRRVEELPEKSDAKEASTSASTLNGTATAKAPQEAASSSTTSTVNGAAQLQAAPQTNGMLTLPTTPTRVRNLQPNKPAVPSPLRQAWRAEPPSPPTTTTAVPSANTSSSPVSRSTRVASATLEILKEPLLDQEPKKKREEFVNPYEGLNPPVKTAKKPPPTRRRRNVDTEKAEEKDAKKQEDKGKEKEAEKLFQQEQPLSPQKIIEATMPKGAKRARPPPELESKKAAAASVEASQPLRRSARLRSPESDASPSTSSFTFTGTVLPTVVVEEARDEEEPSKKKARTTIIVNGTSRKTVTIEEIDDVDMPLAERQKSTSPPIIRPTEIIEVDSETPSPVQKQHKPDAKSPSPPSTFSAPPSFSNPFGGLNGSTSPSKLSAFPGLKSSAPKVSSKLRYSFQVERDEGSGEEAEIVKEDKVKASAKEDTRGLDLLSGAAASVPGAPKLSCATIPILSSERVSERPASSFGMPSVPSTPFTFGTSTASAPSTSSTNIRSTPMVGAASTSSGSFAKPPFPKASGDTKDIVKAMAVSELPAYTFDTPLSSPGAGPSTLKARNEAKAVPISSLPTYDFTVSGPTFDAPKAVASFDWGAAGMKKPAAPSSGWTCQVCMLNNPESAKEKCTVCEAPRPIVASSSSTKSAFDWAAAGIKKPSSAPAGTWKCSECMLDNPDSAKEKCTICEARRPGSAPAVPSKAGFDWSAAGMAKPAAPSAGSWACSTCMLQNPDSAKGKCTVCETPRPDAGAAKTETKVGFNWAAAGLKKPENTSGWTCSVCMVSNPGLAKKCVACESDR